jgi:hypothetical protein
MDSMYRVLSAAAIAMLVAIAPAPLAALASPAPAPSQTPPPTIYHIVTRPLCNELHKQIAPAIGMMLQNDQQIGKSPPLFKRYNLATLDGVDNSASNSNGASGGVTMTGGAADDPMNPEQNMALLGMENLISPIANNIIAVQKVLDSPELTKSTGNPQDDRHLQEIRAKLLQALATQSAALDIISGFVDTQQLADIQHSGQEYISAMSQQDIASGHGTASTPAPFPGTYDPNQAGLPPNPYSINLASIPGLTLGYNPVTRLLDALHWTIDQTQKRESVAAKAVLQSAALCSQGGLAPR